MPPGRRGGVVVIGRAARATSGGLTEELLGLGDSPWWWFAGLCAQTDPELFFPEKGGSVREAKRVCAACPVRAQCLAHALAHGERYGVWGGLSERERRRLQLHAGSAAGASTAPEPAAQQPDPPATVPVAGEVDEVDEVVVARLMAGQPVTAPSRVEVAQAAIGLHRAGRPSRQIAAQLGVHDRQVWRWLARHRAGRPLCRRQPAGPQRRGARSEVA